MCAQFLPQSTKKTNPKRHKFYLSRSFRYIHSYKYETKQYYIVSCVPGLRIHLPPAKPSSIILPPSSVGWTCWTVRQVAEPAEPPSDETKPKKPRTFRGRSWGKSGSFYRVLKGLGGVQEKGGNWGTLKIPREDWGILGKVRGITTPP